MPRMHYGILSLQQPYEVLSIPFLQMRNLRLGEVKEFDEGQS